ncbi:MAG: hypothetical protein V7607_3329 [Solirubrobacteraceae bacterium]
MSPFPRKRAIAIGAAVLAVAGGSGVAIAATNGASSPNDFLDSVAKHLGISRQKLDDATKAAAIDQVDARLAAGKITKDQADQLKKRIQSGDVPPLGGIGGGPGLGFGTGGPGGGPGGPGALLKAGVGDSLAAAAKYLGLSEADLRSQLDAGKSLADVAKAQSKDLDGLEQAILTAAKSDLDKAVTDKQLTQSQADDVYNRLKDNIADMVNGQLRMHFRGGPGGPGVRGPFGADSLAAAAKYLGLTDSALQDKLHNGQSLADVAKAQSKDLGGLEQAILAAQKTELDKAVSDKKLTQSQADDIYNGLKSRIDDVVNGKPGDLPAVRGKRRGWFGP